MWAGPVGPPLAFSDAEKFFRLAARAARAAVEIEAGHNAARVFLQILAKKKYLNLKILIFLLQWTKPERR